MAIYIVDGKPRHGKTAWVISQAPRWLKEGCKEGTRLYSNVNIKVENMPFLKKFYKKPQDCIGDIYSEKDRKNKKKILFFWKNLSALNLMDNGRVIIDEAQRNMNARRWQTLSEDTEIKMQQHGKDALDIWLITQSYTRIDSAVRLMAENIFRVKRWIGFGKNTTLISKVYELELEDIERWERDPEHFGKYKDIDGNEVDNSPKSELFFIWPKIWSYYDTKQVILKSIPPDLTHLEYYCKNPKCRLHKKPKIVHI